MLLYRDRVEHQIIKNVWVGRRPLTIKFNLYTPISPELRVMERELMLAENLDLFENLQIHEKLLRAVAAQGFKTLTEIQKRTIPIILAGQDLKASAETGSGKTLAYILPVLQLILESAPPKEGRGPRVLVLSPTRELANQITETIGTLAKFTNLKYGAITGGVSYYAQEALLRKDLDLLVATPGRLIDHMQRGRVDFSRVQLYILDEADRMLDMGFEEPLKLIDKAMPSKRQTLLFSATFAGNIERIALKFLRNPATVKLTSATMKHALISQWIHLADDFHHKRAMLKHILEDNTVWQAIVFTATKRGADELANDLYSQGVDCAPLHGDMKQGQRMRVLEKMKSGKLRFIIATDVAARGLDVKNLTHVINFDVPKTSEDYTHRIGRTGRCGKEGIAITLVGPKEMPLLSNVQYGTGQSLERKVIMGLEPKRKVESMSGRTPGKGRSFGKPKPGKFSQQRKSRGGRLGGATDTERR